MPWRLSSPWPWPTQLRILPRRCLERPADPAIRESRYTFPSVEMTHASFRSAWVMMNVKSTGGDKYANSIGAVDVFAGLGHRALGPCPGDSGRVDGGPAAASTRTEPSQSGAHHNRTVGAGRIDPHLQ